MTLAQLLIGFAGLLIMVATFIYFLWNRAKYLKPETVLKAKVMDKINHMTPSEAGRVLTAINNDVFADKIGVKNDK